MGRPRSSCLTPAALFFLIAAAATAAAQAPTNRPEDRPQRESEEAAAAARAAAASQNLPEGGPPISFDQILAAPDDLALNYRYALQQMRSGDLRGAATTLERMLLVDPNQSQIRLLYGVVLYRLDDLDEAGREFTALRSLPLDAESQAEIDRYMAQIALRQKRDRFTATLSLGAEYTTNRDAQPRTNLRLFGDVPLQAPSGRHDVGRLAIGSVAVRHDLNTQSRDELIGSALVYYDDQLHVKSQGLKAFELEAGGVIRTDLAAITPTLIYSNVLLDNHPYLSAPGAKLLVERKLLPGLDGFLLFSVEHQDFSANPTGPTVTAESGWRWNAQLGASFGLTPTMQLGATYRHTLKKAVAGFNAYSTNEATLTHTWLLGEGQFLLTTATYGVDGYAAADPFVSANRREDTTIRARTTYGVPLDTIARTLNGALPSEVGDIVLNLTFEANWINSTITNFAYNNYRTQMLLTKRWEF